MSSRAIPSRSRTSSSPITTRIGAAMLQPYRERWVSRLFAAEQLREGGIGEVGLDHERAGTGEPGLAGRGDVPIDRGENNAGAPRERRELARQREPVSVRPLDAGQ